MSTIPPKKPLASISPTSPNCDHSHSVPGAPESPENGSPLDPQLCSGLPPQKVFSTHQHGGPNRQLARAALQYENEFPTSEFGGGELMQDGATGSLAFDPSLSSSFSLGSQGAEGQQIQFHDDELHAGDSAQIGREFGFRPSVLQTGKRRISSLSLETQPQAKRTCEESNRAREIASELEAPLPPANTILAANQQAGAASSTSPQSSSIQNGVFLPPSGLPPQSQQQLQANILADVEGLMEKNQYLELLLFNRYQEGERQAGLIREGNAYSEHAKACMKNDGHDINRLRDLLKVTKLGMERWLATLEPFVVRESPATREEHTEGDTPITRVSKEVEGFIRNFEIALKDVRERPVHEI
ncbi:hypothetical protein TWF718_004754 [Orbilia javanica]|uniref:Uncharacterized protein n=1 Tax=Orbilia javanica TaxID=47235 RepID=A0AAN8RQR3_9PEZI